jgi:peptidoglycan/LPS O-acetylase OafA/YrhL
MSFNHIHEHKHIPAIDGLRVVAILLVLLFHNFNFLLVFNIGWIGVVLFFVISGFLITNTLINIPLSKENFIRFHLRRALRIFLCITFSFFFFYVLPLAISVPYEQAYYLNYQSWFLLYIQNWYFVTKETDQFSYLNHFWTLAVEVQFYIIWPLVVLIISIEKNLLISFYQLF